MDEWVELSPGGGALHVVLEYEPVGMEPQVNDVVFLEAFARSPRSLVLPPNEPMVVRVRLFFHPSAAVSRPCVGMTRRVADPTPYCVLD